MPLQFLGNEQAADDGLLVVLHAAPTDLVAVDDNLPRIGLPVGKLSRRHNVHMPQNPKAARRRAGDARDHIGAHAVGNPRVGRVNAQDVRYAELTQQPLQIQGFGHFARAAVLRAEGGKLRHAGLVFDDLVPLLSDGLNKPRKTCHMFLMYGFGKEERGRRRLPLPWENALPKDGRSRKNCGAYPRTKRFRTA